MIQEAAFELADLERELLQAKANRDRHRNQMHRADELCNELELLNLREVKVLPPKLATELASFYAEVDLSPPRRRYVQDTLDTLLGAMDLLMSGEPDEDEENPDA